MSSSFKESKMKEEDDVVQTLPAASKSPTSSSHQQGKKNPSTKSSKKLPSSRPTSLTNHTTHTSGFSILGVLLLLMGIGLHFWIERRAVQRYQRLAIGLQHVVPWNEHATNESLIYLSTVNSTNVSISTSSVHDELFGISSIDAISLIRKVEIYQWVERKRVYKKIPQEFWSNEKDNNVDDKKTTKKHYKSRNSMTANEVGDMMTKYHYEQKWVPQPVDDFHFRHRIGHRNVGRLPILSQTYWTDQMKMEITLKNDGSYYLLILQDQRFLEQLKRQVPMSLLSQNDTMTASLPEGFQQNGNSFFYRTKEEVPEDPLDDGNGMNDDDNDQDDVHSKQKYQDKTLILETSMKMDGTETTLYQVATTGESFSTRALAEDAVLMQWVQVETIPLDGVERTLYQVEDDRYSSKETALQHAAILKERYVQEQADLPAAQRHKKYHFLPQIGDVRVQFFQVPIPANLSMVGQSIMMTSDDDNQVTTARLVPWIPPGSIISSQPTKSTTSSNSTLARRGIALMEEGYHTPQDLFLKAQKDTIVVTWMGRFGAWLMGMIGTVFCTHFVGASILELRIVQPFQQVLGIWGTSLLLPLVNALLVASMVWVGTQPFVSLAMGCLGILVLIGIHIVSSRRRTNIKSLSVESSKAKSE